MKPDIHQILTEALKLDPSARAVIAETLLDSLDADADLEASEAWRNEIRCRCAEIDSGTVELIQGDQALHELRTKYRA